MATVTTDYRNYIGGAWVAGSAGAYEVINPATEEVVGEAPEGTAGDAEAAAAAARAALPAWKATPAEERGALLQRLGELLLERTDELLPLVMAETGATWAWGTSLQVPQAVNRLGTGPRLAVTDLRLPP